MVDRTYVARWLDVIGESTRPVLGSLRAIPANGSAMNTRFEGEYRHCRATDVVVAVPAAAAAAAAVVRTLKT